jgi:hypothetical protein
VADGERTIMAYPYTYLCGADKEVNGKEVPQIPIYSGYNYNGKLYKGAAGSSTCANNKPLFEDRFDTYRTREEGCTEYFHRERDGPIESVCGTAPPMPEPTSVKGVNGLWYDPQYDGEGFNLIQTPHGLMMFVYCYDKTGSDRLWLISGMLSGNLEPGKDYSIDVMGAASGTLSSPTPGGSLKKWGTVKVNFDATGNAGKFTVSGTDGTKTFNVVQLAGVKAAPRKDLTAVFYDPALDGSGFNLIETSSGLYIFFYGYGHDGKVIFVLFLFYYDIIYIYI